MSKEFPRLFSPLKVGTAVMKNRIQTGPMSIVELDPKGGYTDACYAFYESLAAGGSAVVTLGESIVGTRNGMTHSQQINFENPAVPYYLQRMADVVHARGALIDIEISHGGSVADPAYNHGVQSMGPSAFTDQWGDSIRAMTREDMDEVVEAFCSAAEICRDCGFDLVMIHAGHGWLLHQFLSPKWNHRTDEYGGSRENRARFPLEVVKAVRERVGKSLNLELRVSGDEFIEGGSTIEDCVCFCEQAQEYVDLINVSAGVPWGKRMAISVFEDRGINSEFSLAVKKAVTKCPVSSVGGYTDPVLMERYLEEGRCDSFILGRSILADPELPDKARTGRAGEIHQCLRCYVCNEAQYHDRGRLLRCSINPKAGRELEFRAGVPAAPKKKIIVAGGGPGGLEAAATAAERGHRVILCEKGPELGGWLRRERSLSFKQDMVRYAEVLERECRSRGVEIRLNTPVTREYLEREGADYVICAIGSEAAVPGIPGADLPQVHLAVEWLGDASLCPGQRIVVIGGGAVGCEAGLQLALWGKEVSILEMREEVFLDATADYRRFILPQLEEHTELYCSRTVLEITEEGVLAADGKGEVQLFPADQVLLATGLRARTAEAEALYSDAYELIPVGDVKRPRKVYNAVREGFDAAMYLH